jgi:hypothetical protein
MIIKLTFLALVSARTRRTATTSAGSNTDISTEDKVSILEDNSSILEDNGSTSRYTPRSRVTKRKSYKSRYSCKEPPCDCYEEPPCDCYEEPPCDCYEEEEEPVCPYCP